jgi:hypothetical protein
MGLMLSVMITAFSMKKSMLSSMKRSWRKSMKAKAPGLVTTLFYGVWRMHDAGVFPLVKVYVTHVGINAEEAYGQIVLPEEYVQVQIGQGIDVGGK